jgi:hypothetical protein
VPSFTARLEPWIAVPETTGADAETGSEVEGVITVDQRLVDPMLLLLVVLAVMNLPASSGVWV